jgi:exodeoxyribonuclease VIII
MQYGGQVTGGNPDEPPVILMMTDLSNAKYHADPAVSKSHLDQVARSPAHYWARYLDPDRVMPEPTPAMVLGTALHTAVLEPHLWDKQFVVAPVDAPKRPTSIQRNAAKPSTATLDAIQFWDAFDKQAASKTVLSSDDAARIQRMADSVHQHPASSFMLDLPGTREASYFWDDEETGLKCKCRPDWHSADRRIIVDVKTTEDASPKGFQKSVAHWRYHVQANWYQRPFAAAEQFLFIAVEKQPPFLVACYAASPAMVAAGGRVADDNLRLIATCRASGQWPGYSDQIQPIDLPTWCND